MARPEHTTNVSFEVDASILSNNTLYGVVVVGTAAAELKIGAAALENRNGIIIVNDKNNTSPIYLGLGDVPVLTAANYFYELGVGKSIELTIQKFSDLKVWAIAEVAAQNIMITEVK